MPGNKQRRAARVGTAVARLGTWWLALAGLWLLLADNPALPELVTGAVVATLGAVAAEVVHAQNVVRARVKPSWFRYAWRPLVRLFPDTARVTWALLAQLAGRHPGGILRAVPFRAGDEADANDVARSAAAKAAGSFAPNTYVLGVDRERELLLVHQLVRTGGATELDPLELG